MTTSSNKRPGVDAGWPVLFCIPTKSAQRHSGRALMPTSPLMATMDVYGFAHEDMRAAREAIESVLSIRLEEAQESDGSGYYFRWAAHSDPWLQIRSNSGSSLRWGGDPPQPWHPAY